MEKADDPAPIPPSGPELAAPGSTEEPAKEIEAPSKFVVEPASGELITSVTTKNTYKMGHRIGDGFFGVVYSCTDDWNNDLAAKILKPKNTYEKVKEAAATELEKLFALRHPNITYVYDAFEYRDTFYIVTERCASSLDKFFDTQWFDGSVWIMPLARCLLQAVHFIHLNQMAHQDIHPGNVFATFVRNEMSSIDTEPGIQFRLGDLGVAKLFSEIDAKNTRKDGMLPPEAIDPKEFGPCDHRIDLYHCGLLFLQLAHSRAISFTIDETVAGKPRELALSLSPPLNFALEKALRRHAQYRTASVLELWRDLNSPGIATQPSEVQQDLNFSPTPKLEEATTDTRQEADEKGSGE